MASLWPRPRRFLARPCLIPLQRQHIIRTSCHDLPRDLLLNIHCINDEDCPANIQYPRQLGNRHDFIGFLVTRHLPWRQPVLAGSHTHRMLRAQPLVVIMTPSQCLAVHRQDRDDDHAGQRMPLINARTRIVMVLKRYNDFVQSAAPMVRNVVSSPGRIVLVKTSLGNMYNRAGESVNTTSCPGRP